MLRAADTDIDVDRASVRRPDCTVQLDTPADRDARGSRLEHDDWLSIEVPQRHPPDAPDAEPAPEP